MNSPHDSRPVTPVATPLHRRRLLVRLAGSALCTALPLVATRAAAAAPASAPLAPTTAPVAPASASTPPDLVRSADGRLLAPDIARIVARGELVVAMLGVDTPPFFQKVDEQLVGLDVDMARAIAHELKVKVRFNREARSFNEVVDVIARKEADLGISKLSRTLARAQLIRFSDPYLRLNHALVLNRVAFAKLALDRPVQAVVRNFRGSIGVIAKSSFADYATRNFPLATIRTYPGWPEVIDAVHRGEVVGAYRDELEIKRMLKGNPTAALTLRTVTLKDLEDSLAIAVGVSDPVLLAFVNQYLAQRSDKLDIERVLKALDH